MIRMSMLMDIVSQSWLIGMIVCLLIASPRQARAADADLKLQSGRVTGCVEAEGIDQYRGVASLWDAKDGRVPDPRKYIIVPAAVVGLGADGCFNLLAPAGQYFVGAIVRNSPGQPMGPPRNDDLVFMTPRLDGSAVKVEIVPGEAVDLGLQAGGWPYAGQGDDMTMGIVGRTVDAKGQPVPGLLVFAFADPEVSGSPLVVSERTAENGWFRLRIDRPGKVYLRVKENYGSGAPGAGSYMGVYGGVVPVAIDIRPVSVVEDVLVEVKQIPETMTGARKPGKSGQHPLNR